MLVSHLVGFQAFRKGASHLPLTRGSIIPAPMLLGREAVEHPDKLMVRIIIKHQPNGYVYTL